MADIIIQRISNELLYRLICNAHLNTENEKDSDDETEEETSDKNEIEAEYNRLSLLISKDKRDEIIRTSINGCGLKTQRERDLFFDAIMESFRDRENEITFEMECKFYLSSLISESNKEDEDDIKENGKTKMIVAGMSVNDFARNEIIRLQVNLSFSFIPSKDAKELTESLSDSCREYEFLRYLGNFIKPLWRDAKSGTSKQEDITRLRTLGSRVTQSGRNLALHNEMQKLIVRSVEESELKNKIKEALVSYFVAEFQY